MHGYVSTSGVMRVQAVAESFLEGDCFSTEVGTRIAAETSGVFGVIEGCERGDSAVGDAGGTTDGSTAEGVRCPSPPEDVSVCAAVAMYMIRHCQARGPVLFL